MVCVTFMTAGLKADTFGKPPRAPEWPMFTNMPISVPVWKILKCSTPCTTTYKTSEIELWKEKIQIIFCWVKAEILATNFAQEASLIRPGGYPIFQDVLRILNLVYKS